MRNIHNGKLTKWHCYDGGFWFRVLGFGISVRNKAKHPPLFSERNGYRKVLRIGKWGVEWLRPWNMRNRTVCIRKTALLIALLMLAWFLWTRDCRAQGFSVREVELVQAEEGEKRALLDLSHPLYRCGESVKWIYGQDHELIVWNYWFDGKEWRYQLRLKYDRL